MVNREKLLHFLEAKNITLTTLKEAISKATSPNGKIKLEQLNYSTEGYLFLSRKNKAEKPTNLILKLDFLIKNKIAKRLI